MQNIDFGQALEIFEHEGLSQVPRTLGLIERDAASCAYGCADRYYWHYKFHDFPNARAQESCELLALAFLRAADSPYYQNEKIREWALAAVRYWAGLRHADGSVDEAYPFERSFCATSFSAMHALHALTLLGEPADFEIESTARWLAENDGPDVANQRAASAAALALAGRLTGHDRHLLAARRRAQRLAEEHQRSGHFNEYGGPDTGYASITFSALALYAGVSADDAVADWMRRAVPALAAQLDSQGRYAYPGQSRNTRFFYPYALAWVGADALAALAEGVRADRILKPSWMDDRYMVPFAADYLRAAYASPAKVV